MNRRNVLAAMFAITASGAGGGVVAKIFGADRAGLPAPEALFGTPASAQDKTKATLYRNSNCDCCLEYAKYLRSNGFNVTIDSKQDLAALRKQLRVPENLAGCHVMVMGRYAVEGHVPVNVLNKLLAEHPDIIGVSLPGMPTGTPGMTGPKNGPFTIYEIASDAASPKVFAVE
ncbi:hypothetical protein V1290_005508 [Bradyrhizobium sp. AZCC 1578]|uniref:DUF411 domain-containing protein n=1 Tax=Bradyrhizobium sp. AZCC 1578 TaxID=3117027 RepID=UPI002FF35686